MSDYTRAAIDPATQHARLSSYDIMRAGIDAELVKVSDALASKIDDKVDQAMTVSGAVAAGVNYLSLNHASTPIAATIASTLNHVGHPMMVENISGSGTAAHTVTITTGTWNGTNKIATLNAPGERFVVVFNAAGRGIVIYNEGSVAFSG